MKMTEPIDRSGVALRGSLRSTNRWRSTSAGAQVVSPDGPTFRPTAPTLPHSSRPFPRANRSVSWTWEQSARP